MMFAEKSIRINREICVDRYQSPAKNIDPRYCCENGVADTIHVKERMGETRQTSMGITIRLIANKPWTRRACSFEGRCYWFLLVSVWVVIPRLSQQKRMFGRLFREPIEKR